MILSKFQSCDNDAPFLDYYIEGLYVCRIMGHNYINY